MNFQEMLAQAQKRVEDNSGGREVAHPYKELKHEPIRVTRDKPQSLVRILPPPREKMFFAEETKEAFLTARNNAGKELRFNLVMAANATPDNSAAMKQFSQWVAEERVPARFPKTSSRFYVNAVQILQGPDGSLVHETDSTGNLVVRLMQLPLTVYKSLVGKMGDQMLIPANGDQFGFIGEKNAFPIRVTRTDSSKGVEYSADVYSNKELGPLPANWREQVEDLKRQTTPTEDYNGDFMQYFFDVVNGVEGQPNALSVGGSGAQAPQAPTFTQPAPQFQQAPQAPTFTQPAPQFQQAPQAPQFQQAPPQTTPNMEQVAQQADTFFSQQQVPQAPQAPQAPPVSKDIDDLLANMQAGLQ